MPSATFGSSATSELLNM